MSAVLTAWGQTLWMWVKVLWLPLLFGGGLIYLQRWLEREEKPIARVHWLWGLLLGIILCASAIPVQTALVVRGDVPSRPKGFLDDAYAVILIVLLCVLAFKRAPELPRPEIRVIRPDQETGP